LAWGLIPTGSALALGHCEHFLVTELVGSVDRKPDQRFRRQRNIPVNLKQIQGFARIHAGRDRLFPDTLAHSAATNSTDWEENTNRTHQKWFSLIDRSGADAYFYVS
jgi:hypothetical protein